MASLNKVFLLGNLTRDPDLRGLPSGQSVCELRLAVNRRYVNSSGQEVDEPCFVDVVVWGKSAANCKQYLAKGSQVMVEGRLNFEQWEDRNGGGQRSRLRVVAEHIQFMNRRPEGGYPQQDGDSGGQQPRQGGYSRDGGYPPSEGAPPRASSYSEGTYSRSSRPADSQGQRRAPGMEMPPMPDPGAAGDSAALEDDIPF